MATEIKSFSELYLLAKNEAQNAAPALTDWEEGSINDLIAGVIIYACNEVAVYLLAEFRRTWLGSAEAQDLEDLAVDHYGDSFARPAAQQAVGVVAFSRPTSAAGDVVIPAGTVVKTPTDANGQSQRYETILAVTLTGLSINASIRAVDAGTKGNQEAAAVTVIESVLTDATVVVTNALAISGGAEEEDDDTYRETIRELILALGKATIAAIIATAKKVAGVEKASIVETEQTVIEWDIAISEPIGDAFKIPRVRLYIADANGGANQALIDLVKAAIVDTRACGVKIDVLGATALTVNWKAQLTLNPSGPNFATLSTDTTLIKSSMAAFLNDLNNGETFDRIDGRTAVLATWGPLGTNDLTDFQTVAPTGNVSAQAQEKIIAGTMETV